MVNMAPHVALYLFTLLLEQGHFALVVLPRTGNPPWLPCSWLTLTVNRYVALISRFQVWFNVRLHRHDTLALPGPGWGLRPSRFEPFPTSGDQTSNEGHFRLFGQLMSTER